jgi:hypothetical protein
MKERRLPNVPRANNTGGTYKDKKRFGTIYSGKSLYKSLFH